MPTTFLPSLENSLKHDLDLMDPSSTIYVNPYEVNTVLEGLSALTAETPLQINQFNKFSTKSSGSSNRPAQSAYMPPPANHKIKVEMEEFGDLSTYVPTSLQNTIDELNTPIFSKEPFDFSAYYSEKYQLHQQQNNKREYDVCVNNNQKNLFKDISVSKNANENMNNIQHHNTNGSKIVINTLCESGNNANVNSPPDMFYCQEQDLSEEYDVRFAQSSLSNNNSAVTSPLSEYMEDSIVLNFHQDSNNYLPETMRLSQEVLTIPKVNYNIEDNIAVNMTQPSGKYLLESIPMVNMGSALTSSSVESETTTRPKIKSNLRLNVNLTPSTAGEEVCTLNTPEVLNEVVNLENADFNILDLVNNEDIRILNPDEEFLICQADDITTSAQVSPSPLYSPIKSEQFSFDSKSCSPNRTPERENYQPEKYGIRKPTTSMKKSRKRKASSDEEYLPPGKRKSSLSIGKKHTFEDDSDSESDTETKYKPKPRGRPPKRTESLSSECSKDSDVSKYRELRDKNNEASRRSRYKRKMREIEYEKEAEELESKNIKLKAEVSELEKMVTNFRTNLFKIMINK